MRTRRIIGYSARASVSAGVLAVLVSRTDLAAAAASIGNASLGWVFLGLILLTAGVCVRIFSFMLVVNQRESVVGFRQAAYLTLVGSAAALVLPSGTGDLFKAHVGGRSMRAPEHMTVASVVDKLTSLSAVSAMGVVGSLYTGDMLLAVVAGAVCALSTLLVFVPKLIPWRVTVRLADPGHHVSRDKLERAMRMSPRVLTLVLVVSIFGWLVSYAMIYVLCRAVAAPVSYGYILAIAPLVTLSALLPLSVAGIGVSQLTLVAMLIRGGVSGAVSTQVALLQLGFSLLPPLIGLVLYFAIGAKPWARQSESVAGNTAAVHTRRIAMITTVFPRHPEDMLGSFVASTASSVARAGWRVQVWAPHAPGLPELEEVAGVTVHRFRYLPEGLEYLVYSPRGIPDVLRRRPATTILLPFLALAFMRATRKASRDADIIHAHWAPVGALSTIAVRRKPVVVTLHGTDVAVAERGFVWRWALRSACRRAALALPVSEVLAERVRRITGPNSECKIRVVGNGIDPDLLETLVPDSNRRDIVFVGRLTREKGALDAVRSYALLRNNATRLTMIGSADINDEVPRLAEDLGVSDSITFTGNLPHDEVIERIAGARVVVIPSLDEGFSLVALEAAAVGTPVVASRVGAIADIMGEDGALHDPGDVQAAADLIRRVLDDRDWAVALAAGAKSRVAERFTWPIVASQLSDAYFHVIEQSRGGT